MAPKAAVPSPRYLPAEELPALIARLDGDDVETEEEGEELLVKLLRTASLPVAVAAKYYGFREMDTAPDIAPRCFALDDAPRKRALESQIGKLAASKLSRVLDSVKSGVAVCTDCTAARLAVVPEGALKWSS